MPAVSEAQFKAMQIAKHNPEKLNPENRGLAKMSPAQLNDFTAHKPKVLPQHVNKYKRRPIPGFADGGVVGGEMVQPPAKTLMQRIFGHAEPDDLNSETPYRLSPVGSKEYLLPNRVPDYAVASTLGDSSYYRPESFNDPDTVRHERIHIGQHRLDNPPSVEDVVKTVGTEGPNGFYGKDLSSDYIPGVGRYTYEMPAHEFDTRKYAGTQDAYGKYINMLKENRAGDRGIATIEVSADPVLEQDYLRTTPPPVPKPKIINIIKSLPISGFAEGGVVGDYSTDSPLIIKNDVKDRIRKAMGLGAGEEPTIQGPPTQDKPQMFGGEPIEYGVMPWAGKTRVDPSELEGLINSRDTLYHGTTASGLAGILKDEAITPGSHGTVSLSRVPLSDGRRIKLVIDRPSIGKTASVAEPGFEKSQYGRLNRGYEYEEQIPRKVGMDSVKKALVDSNWIDARRLPVEDALKDANIPYDLTGMTGGANTDRLNLPKLRELFGKYRRNPITGLEDQGE